MIVDYIGDIHVNHWIRFSHNAVKWEKMTRKFTRSLIRKGKGEVIVVCGDFGEFNRQNLWVMDEMSKKYKRVYYTYGNHDLYLLSKTQENKYGDSMGRLNELISQSLFIKNVVPLIKTSETYKGVTFAGDVMWYMPNNDKDWSFYNEISNDSTLIKIKGESKRSQVEMLYKRSMEWYNRLEDEKIDVFVSHVPPVNIPESDYSVNGCYTTTVPFLVSSRWICGHQHEQKVFEKADTTFYMNSLGYPSEHCFYMGDFYKNHIPEDDIDIFKEFGVKSFTVNREGD